MFELGTVESIIVSLGYLGVIFGGSYAYRKLNDFIENPNPSEGRVYVVKSGGNPERTYDYIKQNAATPYRMISLIEEDESIKTPQTAAEAYRLLRQYIKIVRKVQADIYVVGDFKTDGEYRHFFQLADLFGVSSYLVEFNYDKESEEPRRTLSQYINNSFEFILEK